MDALDDGSEKLQIISRREIISEILNHSDDADVTSLLVLDMSTLTSYAKFYKTSENRWVLCHLLLRYTG